jgi:hypothetical protein
MTLQQFADRYGLPVEGNAIRGPRGQIILAYAGWSYFCFGIGSQKFNPVTRAEEAIHAIGLSYTPPQEPNVVVKEADGWYVAARLGPFKTREDAIEGLKNNQQETTIECCINNAIV